MIETVNLERLKQRVQEDAKSFREAKPFPHIVVDDLLADGLKEQILCAFPKDSWDGWFRFRDKCQFRKLTCDQIDKIPEPLDWLILEWKEKVLLKVFKESPTACAWPLHTGFLSWPGI